MEGQVGREQELSASIIRINEETQILPIRVKALPKYQTKGFKYEIY